MIRIGLSAAWESVLILGSGGTRSGEPCPARNRLLEEGCSSRDRAPRIVSGLRRDRPAGRCCAGVRTGAKEGAVFKKRHAAGQGPMLLVTGGAGFIGSNVGANLNDRGRTDIAVSDRLETGSKWRNLQKRQLADVVAPADLEKWLAGRKLDAVIHLGAISDTTASDGDLVIATNFGLSLRLLDWCTAAHTPFIYASSAATYGDGADGFGDDW